MIKCLLFCYKTAYAAVFSIYFFENFLNVHLMLKLEMINSGLTYPNMFEQIHEINHLSIKRKNLEVNSCLFLS